MDRAEFERRMTEDGFAVFERAVPPDLLEALRRDIPRRIDASGEWQRRNGIADAMEGAAHHVVGGDDSLATFLETPWVDDHIRHHFDGSEFILNSYGAIDNLPLSEKSPEYVRTSRWKRCPCAYDFSDNGRLSIAP